MYIYINAVQINYTIYTWNWGWYIWLPCTELYQFGGFPNQHEPFAQ
jgi:hypothetical protein